MTNSPTIVAATLDSQALESAINNLVAKVNKSTKQMADDFTTQINRMNEALKTLGTAESGSKTDGGASRRAQAQKEEEEQVKKTTQAHKELSLTLDQQAAAQQKATGRVDVIRQYDEQLERLKARLVDVRNDIDIFNYAIGSGKKSQVSWGQEGLKKANEEAERLMKTIATLERQRGNLADVVAPQGHTIQNYVNNIQRANPELVQLNQQFKSGTSLLQTQSAAMMSATNRVQTYTDEVTKMANAIRASQEWQEKGTYTLNTSTYSAKLTKDLPLEQQLTDLLQTQGTITATITSNIKASDEATKSLANSTEKTANSAQRIKEGFSIPTFQPQLESADHLKARLKDLQALYRSMTYGQRMSEDGQRIAQQIRTITRESQKLEKQINVPTKKEAFGLSESTLDNIAYKIRQLNAYKMNINVTEPKSLNEMRQVDAEITRLKKQYDDLIGKQSQVIASNTALGRSWNYMKNRLAFYFTVGAGTAFLKNLVEVRSQYEMNERALGILVDSAERGTQIFKELSQMSLVSPYTLIELSTAAKQLTAYDVAARDVVDTTRRLADMTAAVGIPVERLTYALGQIKAYGYLNARDARMFSNAGIPLVKQLSEYYTELEGKMVSVGDVYDRIKKKAIDYNEVMAVINKMTDEGGKFFGFQEKMADTLKVQLANLTLAWNNMLNDIGKDSQGLLSGGIKALKEIFLQWKDIERVLNDVVIAYGALKAVQLLSYAIFGKGTLAAIKQTAALEGVTAADYKVALSKKKLNAEQAMFLVSLKKLNRNLRNAILQMRLLSAEQDQAAAHAGKLKTAWLGIQAAMSTANAAIASFGAALTTIAPQLAVFAIIGTLVDITQMLNKRAEAVKEFYDTLVRNSKESVDSIEKYFSTLTYADATTLGLEDQQKAWDNVREEIEMSTAAANAYLAELSKESDIGKRTNEANTILKKITEIHGLMTEWQKDDIKLTQDFKVLGLGADGLSTDLQDFLSSYNEALKNSNEGIDLNMQETNGLAESWERVFRAISGYGEFFMHGANIPIIKEIAEAASAIAPPAWMQKLLFGGELWGLKMDGWLRSSKEGAQIDLNELEDEVSTLVESLKERLDRSKVEDPLKIREALQKTLEAAGYTGQELETLTILATKRMRELYADAYEGMSQDGKDAFDKYLSSESAALEGFFNFVKNRNSSLLSNIAEEDLRTGKWLTEERNKRLNEYLQEYMNTHSYAYADLVKYVNQANRLSIYIPVYFQMSQTPSDVARDYERRTGKRFSTDAVVKDATTQVEVIDKLKKAQKEAENAYLTAKRAGGQYWEENEERLRKENEALKDNIHAYNALTDAEEKTNKKKGGGGRGNKKDLVLEALKQEISLVDKLRSEYDKLVKSGATQADALETVRSAFGNTITLLNAKLGSSGLPTLDLEKIITGKDPHTALEHFKKTLDTLVSKGMLNLERSKELEAVIEKLTLSAKTYDLEKITKGLNNELDKLKDEYELAVELDANPELGDMFAQMFGIDTSKLPSTFGEALDMAQKVIDQKLKEMNINVPFNLMRGDINKFIESAGVSEESGVVKELISAQKTWQDMFKKNITDTEKVLDDYIKKYGDYSDKIAEIEANRLEQMKKLNEAYYTEEMRRMPEYLAKMRAIQQGADRQKQSAAFEEFKNSRYYTMMFENLDYISTKTISDMRDKLLELRDSMNELTPEQLKWVTQQYEKLEQKLIKRSPFKTLTKDVKEYFRTLKERKVAIEEFRDVQKQYNKQLQIVAALKERREQLKRNENVSKLVITSSETELGIQEEILAKLKEQLDAAQEKVDKYNLIKKLALEEAQAVANMVSSNLKGISELRDNLKETFGLELSNELDAVIDDLSKVGDGIGKVNSSAQSGDVFGIVSGAVDIFTGIGDAIASIFGDGSARTKRINKEIERSVEVVRQLNMAYKELERTVAKTSGAEETAARRSEIANKKAQLAELERQMELEKSKRSKDRDDEKIKQYEETIQDLRHEIDDLTDDVVNNLLGTDAKNAAEAFVDTWVDAWRAGETTLDAIAGKMDEMIFNLIKKAATAKIVQNILKPLYEAVDKYTSEDSEGGVNLTTNELKALAALAASLGVDINEALTVFYGNLESLGGITREIDNGSKNLSALQQGISQVSEQTASAVEAYLNGVSQQAYLRNDLLTQIRDGILGINTDLQVGVQTQILFEIQSCYQVQKSIQSVLEGWNNPSGNAVRVELIS